MLTALDVHHVVQRLNNFVGSRFKNAYHNRELVIIQLHKSETINIHITPSQIFEDSKGVVPLRPSPLAQILRNSLTGSKLVSVEQPGTERIIFLSFDGVKKSNLVIELFSTGNLIITDNNGVIITAKTFKEWKHRSIKKGVVYSLPPACKNILIASADDFVESLKKYDGNSEKTLALEYGLGGVLARLIVQKTASSEPGEILAAVKHLWNESPPDDSLSKKDFVDSISVQKRNINKDKILDRIKIQEAHLKILALEERDNSIKGRLIYENYENVKTALSQNKKKFLLDL
ncbi:NFACT family protein [Candidatus Woesearchaeota archaeon]|nr:NFACT family protein [Candidatus Woesearchaeota archaeon]